MGIELRNSDAKSNVKGGQLCTNVMFVWSWSYLYDK